MPDPAVPADSRRNPHCSRCGDTRGGPFGHETSECTYRRPPEHPGGYAVAWAELRGYVAEAVEDGGTIDPAELLAYMDELKRQALAPTLQWIKEMGRG